MAARVFFSYCHADEALRDQIEKQLSVLKRQGVVETWHDRRIEAGQEIDAAITEHLELDDIILLLVSPDFLNSDYCYDKEMIRAIERHDQGEAVVIPIILRPCDWHSAPFGKLNAVPADGHAITRLPDRDEAMLQVAKAVRKAAERVGASAPTKIVPRPVPLPSHDQPASTGPRSSNLRLAKQFTQRERDHFLTESFEFIARFFENSLQELARRNAGCEGAFRQINANKFFATIYLNGKDVARCTISIGTSWGAGITYAAGEIHNDGQMNEHLRVDADDQSLYLVPFGLGRNGGSHEKLSMEGGAEYLWQELISRLQ